MTKVQIRQKYSMPFRHGVNQWAYSVKRPDGGKNCTSINDGHRSYADALAHRKFNIDKEIENRE